MMMHNLVVLRAVLWLMGAIVLVNPEGNNTSVAEEPVYIPDPNLKAAIEKELGVSNPTPTQMLALGSLSLADSWTIKPIDLNGLQYAANLSQLTLFSYRIADLAPISRLPKLAHLDLSGCMIEDMSPLSGLPYIRYLTLPGLSGPKPLDLSPISKLRTLWGLALGSDGLSDLSPLATITGLRMLWLNSNSISDLSPLARIKGLRTLDLNSNLISDLSPLAGMKILQTLNLGSNQISDISVLSGLTELNTLDVSENNIRDLSPLLSLTKLQALDLSFNPLDDEAFTSHILTILKNNPGLRLDLVLDVPVVWVQIQSTRGGTIVYPGEGRLPFTRGTVITVEAQSKSACPFLGWTGTAVSSGRVADPKAAITRVTLDENCTLVANFLTRPILYVDTDASGANDGSSWTNAFRYLQDALALAGSGDEVRVAEGTYRADQGATVKAGDRNAFFHLKNDVSLKGGYVGFLAHDPNVRDVKLYLTILSGDLKGNDARTLTSENISAHSSR